MAFSHSVSNLSYSIIERSKSLPYRSIAAAVVNFDPRNVSPKAIANEVWLVTNLAAQLAMALGSRLIWIWMFFRFMLYVSLLMFAFVRAGFVFLISDHIRRSIRYGPNPRNYLDIYIASDIMKQRHKKKNDDAAAAAPCLDRTHSSHSVSPDNKYPVVVFLSGGAWIIGYKAWGCFMGMLMAQLGVVFVAPDYRNFPQGTISDMVMDATNAIQWTRDNIHTFGGDKNNIYVVSQSAGAHIGAMMMLLQARKVEIYKKLKAHLIELKHYAKHTPQSSSSRSHIECESSVRLKKNISTLEQKLMSAEFDSLWNPQTDLQAFIGIAGPYNLEDMKYYLDHRGLYTDIIDSIMENDLRSSSPFYCVQDLFISPADAKHKLKPLSSIDSTDASKPFVSMTEIEFDGTALNDDIDDDDGEEEDDTYDVSDEWNEGSTKSKRKKHKYTANNPLRLSNLQRIDMNPNFIDMHNTICTEKVDLKLPPMYLFHGETDLSCPVSNTKQFSLALANYGVKTFIKIYANKSHTAPIIEDPISGKDPLMCDMLQIIYPNQSLTSIVHEIEASMTGGLKIPQRVIDMAGFVCPF